MSGDCAIRELSIESRSIVEELEEALRLDSIDDDISSENQPFQVLEEAKHLFHIALPSILIQLSLFFIFPQSASAVGKILGPVELGGFSLGSLIGNMTILSILEGTLTAADTLMPRAFGCKRFDEVARLLIRSIFVCSVLLIIPIVPLWFYSETLLVALGQDPEASHLAQEWIRYYFLGAPANLLFRAAMRFLLAQNEPWPLVYCSMLPCLSIHPIVLSILVPHMGLPGSALAISFTQWSVLLLLGLYLWIKPPYHPETWPGCSYRLFREALRPSSLCKFISLGIGGVFSLSEWWFWEIMCFVAGSFGVVSLVAHTIAYKYVRDSVNNATTINFPNRVLNSFVCNIVWFRYYLCFPWVSWWVYLFEWVM